MNVLKKGYWSKTFVLLLVFLVMASFIPADVGSEEIPLEEFLIITENGMDLNGVFVGRNKGHICSRTGIIRVGPDKVCVPEVPKKEARRGFIGVSKKAIPTENRLECYGNKSDLFYVRGNLQNLGCKIHNEDEGNPLVCAKDPEFPPPEEFVIPPDAKDVEVPRKGKMTIHPDKYRDLILNNRSRVTLTGPGTYLFRRIIAKARSKWVIEFDMTPVCDPAVFITINVRDFASLAEDGCINPKPKGKLLPYGIEPIYLNIAGYDDEYPEENACGPGYGADPEHIIPGYENTKAVFCFKGDGQLNLCRVHAPNGTIKLAGRLDTNVQFLSEWFVKVRRNCLPVKIGLMPPCCRPICPCIISHPVLAEIGQEIIVTGMGFSEETVKKILFFESEKPLTGDRATDLDVDLDYPDEYADGEAEPEILSARTLKVVVPSLEPGKEYHLTLANGTFCAGPRSSGMLLKIISP